MEIKVKFKTLNDYSFQSVISKIANLQTSTMNASKIRRITKLVQAASDQMREEFKKDVMELFAARDEAGKIVATKDKPFDVPDDKVEAFTAATDVFGEREATINWTPLDASTLGNAQVSAREIDLLGGLYSEEPVGPGLPAEAVDVLGNVHNLRK